MKKTRLPKQIFLSLLALLLLSALLFQTTACGTAAAGPGENSPFEEKFTEGAADFAISLFQKSLNWDKNTLLSPLSALLALAMTANGAEGETLAQMVKLFGEEITLEELNEVCRSLHTLLSLDKADTLQSANGIWIRDSFSGHVKESFLQKAQAVYDAEIRKAPFDEKTRKEINVWVKEKTGGKIDEFLSQIREDACLYLINALTFEAKWEKSYDKSDLQDGFFTSFSGKEEIITMLSSVEEVYLEDKNTTGFIKNYAGGGYGFVALLPSPETDIFDYVASLTGEKWSKLLASAESSSVLAELPRFHFEDNHLLNNTLQEMGMTDAFNTEKADFSAIADPDQKTLYISTILQKTYIELSEKGTEASAVTGVTLDGGTAPAPQPQYKHTVILDRPFVFAIVDNTSGLPIFLGTVLNP